MYLYQIPTAYIHHNKTLGEELWLKRWLGTNKSWWIRFLTNHFAVLSKISWWNDAVNWNFAARLFTLWSRFQTDAIESEIQFNNLSYLSGTQVLSGILSTNIFSHNQYFSIWKSWQRNLQQWTIQIKKSTGLSFADIK